MKTSLSLNFKTAPLKNKQPSSPHPLVQISLWKEALQKRETFVYFVKSWKQQSLSARHPLDTDITTFFHFQFSREGFRPHFSPDNYAFSPPFASLDRSQERHGVPSLPLSRESWAWSANNGDAQWTGSKSSFSIFHAGINASPPAILVSVRVGMAQVIAEGSERGRE